MIWRSRLETVMACWKGEIEGVLDGVFFRGVRERRVLECEEAEAAQDRLEFGADVTPDGGESTRRRSEQDVVQEGLLL